MKQTLEYTRPGEEIEGVGMGDGYMFIYTSKF